MALEKKHIDLSNSTEETVSTKLYLDQYNNSELSKSVSTQVTELIKPLPTPRLDLVPKPIYDTEVQLNAELNTEITLLNSTIDDLTAKLATKTADSSSLYIDNDNLRIQNAALLNRLGSIQQTTLDLKTNLTTSLTKAINEATERTALEAENNGLTAQKNALIKQIDTLNNLLAQANATIQVAQQQLSAKQQAIGAGGISTGELSTIVFDGGDISKWKEPNKLYADCGDWGGHHGPNYQNDPLGYYPQGNKEQFSKYFDVVAGPKDISVNLKFTGETTINPFNMGFTLPVTLKANETKRFDMSKVNTAWNQNGAYDTGFWTTSWHASTYKMNMAIEIKDVDPSGKTESKNFDIQIFKYWKQ